MRMRANARLWAVLSAAMLVPFVGSLFYFVLCSGSAFGKGLYAASKLFTIAWPLFCVYVVLGERLWPGPRGVRRHLNAIPVGAGLGLLIVGLIVVLLVGPMNGVAEAAADAVRDKVAELGLRGWFVPFALFISVIHSFIEEYYWRWFVYGRLRRLLPMGPALVLGALSFMLHHVVITSQLFPFGWALMLAFGVGAGGVIWSVMFERQQTLAGIWVSHMIVDLGVMAIGYRMLEAGGS